MKECNNNPSYHTRIMRHHAVPRISTKDRDSQRELSVSTSALSICCAVRTKNTAVTPKDTQGLPLLPRIADDSK